MSSICWKIFEFSMNLCDSNTASRILTKSKPIVLDRSDQLSELKLVLELRIYLTFFNLQPLSAATSFEQSWLILALFYNSDVTIIFSRNDDTIFLIIFGIKGCYERRNLFRVIVVFVIKFVFRILLKLHINM